MSYDTGVMSLNTDPRLAWTVAIRRYTDTVRMGGTPHERRQAWDRANQALDRLMDAEKTTAAGRDTESMEAV